MSGTQANLEQTENGDDTILSSHYENVKNLQLHCYNSSDLMLIINSLTGSFPILSIVQAW